MVAVPSLNVEPVILAVLEIAPLVIELLLEKAPALRVAVPSVSVTPVILAEVEKEPDLSVATPSVSVAPVIDATLEIAALVMPPLLENTPA